MFQAFGDGQAGVATAAEAARCSREDDLRRRGELSAARAATWSNTLQASHARKEAAKKQRAADDEAERRKVRIMVFGRWPR